MKVPDVVDWLKPHELLLTTGCPLREVPGGLASLVSNLDDAQVAALGVKLRRYLDELPPAMIAEADRRGLQGARLRRSDESVKARRWLGKACRSERSSFDKLGSARRLTPGTVFRHCGCR